MKKQDAYLTGKVTGFRETIAWLYVHNAFTEDFITFIIEEFARKNTVSFEEMFNRMRKQVKED